MSGRISRGPGPKKRIKTKRGGRIHGLPFLLRDFERRCAYCLLHYDHVAQREFEVEHFDRSLPEPQRYDYSNLMLACDVCNGYKGMTPIQNPFDPTLRLLNCTAENEFPEHIVEDKDGNWIPKTSAGIYHIENLGLQDAVHLRRRMFRNRILQEIKTIQGSIRFNGPITELESKVRGTLEFLKEAIRTQIPLPTEQGLVRFD